MTSCPKVGHELAAMASQRVEVTMTDYERTTVQRTVDQEADVAPTQVPSAPTRMASEAARTTVTSETARTSVSGLTAARRFVIVLFAILEILILLRIVLLLLVANHDNGIVAGVLGITDVFVEPFRGMFRFDRVTSASSGSVLDIAAVVALIGWGLVEAVVLMILRIGERRDIPAA
jgi:hypothetical protein